MSRGHAIALAARYELSPGWQRSYFSVCGVAVIENSRHVGGLGALERLDQLAGVTVPLRRPGLEPMITSSLRSRAENLTTETAENSFTVNALFSAHPSHSQASASR
jgi:hypothetical protein